MYGRSKGTLIQTRHRYTRIMSDAANGATLGWRFTYSLSESIDYDTNLHGWEDVEFVTDVDMGQTTMTGFKIMVNMQELDSAKKHANQMALRLTSLLVSISRTDSICHLDGYEEIKTAGKRKVVRYLDFGYKGSSPINIDSMLLSETLNLDPDLAARIRYIAGARRASKIKDHPSVIRYLVMACNDNPTGVWAKFVCLRHALSHNDGLLHKPTRNGLKLFGSNYFILTSDKKFDYDSESNKYHLEVEADKFLTYMYDCLKNELQGMKELSTDG